MYIESPMYWKWFSLTRHSEFLKTKVANRNKIIITLVINLVSYGLQKVMTLNSHELFLLVLFTLFEIKINNQKQPSRRVPREKCSENMQQINRRTLMSKCYFSKLLCSFIKIITLLKSYFGMGALL